MRIQEEPYNGWRIFRLKGIAEKDPVLISVSRFPRFTWNGPVATAEEMPQRSRPFSWKNPFGALHNYCGIYAYKEPQSLTSLLACLSVDGLVAGTVELEGRVIRHEWGYRAERAVITALDLSYSRCVMWVPSYMAWLMESWKFCDHRLTHWCQIDSVDPHLHVPRTRSFCAEHIPAHLPRMPIDDIAQALMRRYHCDVTV